MQDNKIKIGLTQGDTNGVGWELILKIFADQRMTELCTPVLYGHRAAADFYRQQLPDMEGVVLENVADASQARKGRINFVELTSTPPAITPGKPSKEAGRAAAEALQRAVEDLKAGEIDAVVTAPIDKESIHCEAFPYTGHTEFFAAEFGGDPLMILFSERLRVGLVTIHLPVAQVSAAITREKIVGCLKTLRQTLKQDFGIVEPRIAVMALNPHAGDGGLLGTEEQQTIKPAIDEAFAQGILAYGPFAADGLFASGNYARYDAVLAMYHDQGLAPFKTLSPDGVNFTAAIPCVRTSPDHGVAYDIAGQGQADPASMRNAVYAAIDIVRNRRAWKEWSANPLQHVVREHRDNNRDNGRDNGRDNNRDRRDNSREEQQPAEE